jgi:mannose-6-phosphate isomerase
VAVRNLEPLLNRFEANDRDVFFIEARTVHALGEGCLLYEVQQTCDITFRVYDWDRMGLDGKPRPLHQAESLATIDFSRTGFGPIRAEWQGNEAKTGAWRDLVSCSFFTLGELRLATGLSVGRELGGVCAVITCIAGQGEISTPGGSLPLTTMQTVLVPAAAQTWTVRSDSPALDLLVAKPVL